MAVDHRTTKHQDRATRHCSKDTRNRVILLSISRATHRRVSTSQTSTLHHQTTVHTRQLPKASTHLKDNMPNSVVRLATPLSKAILLSRAILLSKVNTPADQVAQKAPKASEALVRRCLAAQQAAMPDMSWVAASLDLLSVLS